MLKGNLENIQTASKHPYENLSDVAVSLQATLLVLLTQQTGINLIYRYLLLLIILEYF